MQGDALTQVPIVYLEDDGTTAVYFRTWSSNEEELADLERIAFDAARDPLIIATVRSLPNTELETIHDFRLRAVRFVDKTEQIIQTPRYTLHAGAGDCVDAALLGAAMLTVAGWGWRFVPMGGTPLDPNHLSLGATKRGALHEGPTDWQPIHQCADIPGLTWSDTSVQPRAGCHRRGEGAKLGEHPWCATVRLSLEKDRPELAQRTSCD